MEESNVEMVLALIAVFGAVVFLLFYWIKKSPLYCDCYDGPHVFEGERVKCQYEVGWEQEIRHHKVTMGRLITALGQLDVAEAEVSRLHKELDYLQVKYERVTENKRVTVLPDWSELETDPRKICFGGEEVAEDEVEYSGLYNTWDRLEEKMQQWVNRASFDDYKDKKAQALTTTEISEFLISKLDWTNMNDITLKRVGMLLKKYGYLQHTLRRNSQMLKVWIVRLTEAVPKDELKRA